MTRTMAHILLAVPLLFGAVATTHAQSLSFSGSGHKVITETADPATGLNGGIHIVYSLDGVSAHFTPSGSGDVEWYRFGNSGSAGATLVQAIHHNDEWVLDNLEADCGYMIMDGNRSFCFWITDYSAHRFTANALSVAEDSDCQRTLLDFTGNAAPIRYYGTNGRMYTLSRDIEVTYRSLSFDEASFSYVQTEVDKTLASIDRYISVEAPLCDTQFTLRGDRFQSAWGEETEITTPLYRTTAVDARTSVQQSVVDTPNQKPSEGGAPLGGSAPVDVHFDATVSDKVVFTEWQFSGDYEFTDVDMRFTDTEFDYTFRESGTTYVRFVAADASGQCTCESDIYTVSIGESALECPNAFSPYNADGVNDEWKVSYRSLVSFECHIFNRWGEEMAAFNDASSGWDGRYKGKLVPPGVYYYVIIAEGADGKRYRKSGDINLVGTKRIQ